MHALTKGRGLECNAVSACMLDLLPLQVKLSLLITCSQLADLIS